MLIEIVFVLEIAWNSWHDYLHVRLGHRLRELINILLVLFESDGRFLSHIKETLIQLVKTMFWTGSLILE